MQWYKDKIRLTEGDTYTLEYSMINDAFGKPAGTVSDITMVQNDRLPIVEVDDYPPEATMRAKHDGMLPPGNGLVSLAVNNLDDIAVDWIKPPSAQSQAPYLGRRAATTIGPAGELLELIEIG